MNGLVMMRALEKVVFGVKNVEAMRVVGGWNFMLAVRDGFPGCDVDAKELAKFRRKWTKWIQDDLRDAERQLAGKLEEALTNKDGSYFRNLAKAIETPVPFNALGFRVILKALKISGEQGRPISLREIQKIGEDELQKLSGQARHYDSKQAQRLREFLGLPKRQPGRPRKK